jgi:ferredoxin-NADP reductase
LILGDGLEPYEDPYRHTRTAPTKAMTALTLLYYIVAAMLVQVMLAAALAAVRYNSRQARQSDGIALVEVPAWIGLRAFTIVSRKVEDEAQTQASFYLEPVDHAPLPIYKAGQFLTFKLDVPDKTGEVKPVTRCYSLSDRAEPTAYRITVKRAASPRSEPNAPAGLVSGYFHDHVFEGTILQVRAPAGSFVLGDDAHGLVVLIAGGIGITPLFAMARGALATQTDRAIHLFYGVADHRDIVFKSDLEAMLANHRNFRVTIIASSPLPTQINDRFDHEVGFIDIPLLRRILPHSQNDFYLCGPSPMLASLLPALNDWGVARNAIHYEAFGPDQNTAIPDAVAMPLAVPLVIQFTQSGRTLSWTGEDANLLDFAEAHGVEVPSGCRSGSCGTCETTIGSGKIRYTQTPSYDVAAQKCLVCIAIPDGDLELVA